MAIVAHCPLPLVGSGAEQYFTVYNGMQVIGSGDLVLKGFDLISNAVDGWLILADPRDLTLRTVQPGPGVFAAADDRSAPGRRCHAVPARCRVLGAISDLWRPVRPRSGVEGELSDPGQHTGELTGVLFGDHIALSDNTSPVAATEIQLFT